MHRFFYDKSKNRIYIFIEGTLTEEEIESYKTDLIGVIKKTQRGFTVFADATRAYIDFLENSWRMQPARDYGISKGFLGVATVLNQNAFEIHQKTPFRGIMNTFTDASEAEVFLDSLSKMEV